MTPKQFLAAIKKLPARLPVSDRIQKEHGYRNQKEHWVSWLSAYSGPGFYNRKNATRDARFIWNHIQCAEMLIWLAEAVRLDGGLIDAAVRIADAGRSGGTPKATRCAAVRSVLQWSLIASRLQGF